jgi:hypothetical protein
LFERSIAKILAPIPGSDVTGEWVRERIHAKRRMLFVKTAKKDRSDVALFKFAAFH